MSDRPLLLDLFCGAGGASVGYHRAGFDVIGIDVASQPNYPFRFIQADALLFLEFGAPLQGIYPDAVHASPPCHDHSRYTSRWGLDGTGYLLPSTRKLLSETGLPCVIENVPGAGMRADYKLCGCYFNLPGLRRQRWFETSWQGSASFPAHNHDDRTVTVTGHPGGSSRRDGTRGFGSFSDWKRAMDIDWMKIDEITQAIPPAYTEFIGGQLLQALERAA